MLAWVAGEDWKLEAFRAYDRGDGPDVYNLTAVSILGGDPYTVAKSDRNVFGKVPDLACGYQGGVGALQTFCKAYGVRMTDHLDTIKRLATFDKAIENWDTWGRARAAADDIERTEWVACETVKLAWRGRHPATQRLWWDLESAARSAIENPGAVYAVGRHLRVGMTEHHGQQWLLVRMPSKKYLTYFAPRLTDEGERTPTITYMGMGSEDGKPGSRAWVRLRTHGGKLVENLVQSLSRDVLAYNMPVAEEAGYEIVLTVHDELVTQTPDTSEHNVDALSAIMARVPPWADGLPLAAAGFETYRYRKE